MMNVQQNGFAERIARINHAQGKAVATVYVGEKAKKTKVKLTPEARRSRELAADIANQNVPVKGSKGWMTLPLAFLMGCVSLILWKMAVFHLPAVQDEFGGPVANMALTTAIATAMAILLCETVSLVKPQHVLVAFIGVVAMVLGMHNLVHAAPDQFAALFSQPWVDQITAQMPAKSVVFAGVLYPFS